TLVYCFTEAGHYTRTPHVVWGILSSCIFSAEFAFALVVNTNEKTTAATVLMSIFFALKIFVVITLILLIILCYYLCRLFLLTLQGQCKSNAIKARFRLLRRSLS
ncbi:MAG: hypothetical protein J6W38_09310, partial [Prevotella sp.]|nr:hypothetical protein [Prevotella sp.]